MSIKNSIKRILCKICVNGFRALYGVDSRKVMFISFSGKSYSDNPKAISEALHKLRPDIHFVWGIKKPNKKIGVLPDYVTVFNFDSKKEFYKELATCGTIVTNFGLPEIVKDSKQFFIQTWHGDRAFKKVLYDSTFISKDFYVTESKDGYCDLAIAGSDYGERQYRSAFRYNGEVMKVGTPRNDVLINPDSKKISDIKRNLGINTDVKVLLYAPTLRRINSRDHLAQEVKSLSIGRTLNALGNKYGEKWICLMRAHPARCGLSGVEYNENIRDVSDYEDMAELMLISDMLITDYSSCAGDFVLLNRPVVLYQADRKEYIEKDRTFYFNIEDSPYYVAESQAELENIINKLEDNAIKQNCKDILDFYVTYESGHSAEAVAKRICERIPQ